MMVDQFLDFIVKHALFTKNERILVAVSGGIDSMVLLDLLVRAGFTPGIIHCNFQLRSEESDLDEELVVRRSKDLKLDVYTRRFNTKEYALESKVSVQVAARELRYKWFEEIRTEMGYDLIATAHHHDDNVETMLFNLIKGTGLSGLTGIPLKNNRIVRPLLFAHKQDIEEYATQHGIDYRLDQSNLSTDYHRNLVRHELIPIIQKINPGFTFTSEKTLKRLNETYQFIVDWLAVNNKKYLKERGKYTVIEKEYIRQMKNASVLFELLKRYGFNWDQASQVYENFENGVGNLFFSESHVLNIDRDTLVINKNIEEEGPVIINGNEKVKRLLEGTLKLDEITVSEVNLSDDQMSAFLDHSKLHFPLILRSWEKGDWFIPLGMKGKKKLSDFMIDNKIPLNLKKRVKVLVSNGDIAWIVGYRIDDRFKITSGTQKAYHISFKKND